MFDRSLAYSTTGGEPAAASPDQMFRPLDLTLSFVHTIVTWSGVMHNRPCYSLEWSAT